MPASYTNLSQLSSILGTLTPQIQERAFSYAMRSTVLPSRVTLASDMEGYNTRNVSEYLRGKRARKLSEATAYTDQVVKRVATNAITPDEWGDKYPISERRFTTDLESVLRDIIRFLGDSLGMRKEKQLFKTILSTKTTANTITVAGSYTMPNALALQAHANKLGWAGGELFTVIHPYQVLDVRSDLHDLTKPINTSVDKRINSWIMNGGMGVELVESANVPRKITYKFNFGTISSGTFKLRAGETTTGDEAITANITYNAAHATMLANILAGLNALSIGTWTGSSTAITDITIVSPIYVDAEDELAIPVLADGTLDSALVGGTLVFGEKSATCASPLYAREAFILDVRSGVEYNAEYDLELRTLFNRGREVYGTGKWQNDRVLFLETDATSPFALT